MASEFSEYVKKRKAEEEKQGGEPYYSDWRDEFMAYKAKRDAAEGKLEASVGALGDRVSKWRENAGKYYTDYATRYDVEEGSYVYRGDTEDYLNGVTVGRDDLNHEAESIRRELEFYKPYVSEEYYNYLIGALDGSIKGDDGSVITFDTVVDNATKDHDFYSQFEDEEAYKGAWYNKRFTDKYKSIFGNDGNYNYSNIDAEEFKKVYDDFAARMKLNYDSGKELTEELRREGQFLDSIGNYLTLKNYDADAAEAEIAELEAELNGYGSWVERFGHRGEDAVLDAVDWLAGGVSLPRQGDYIEDLEAEIHSKKQQHKEMLDGQKMLGYESQRQNEDFDEHSEYDPALTGGIDIDWLKSAIKGTIETQYNGDLLYDIINGSQAADTYDLLNYLSPDNTLEDLAINLIRGDFDASDISDYVIGDSIVSLSKLALKGGDSYAGLTQHMEEEERQLFNYIYHTQGKEAAHEYYSLLSNRELMTRKLDSLAGDLENVPTALKLAYSLPAGIDQFASGVEGIFKDEYDPSFTSMAGQKVREDLADEAKISWYNARTGSWENGIAIPFYNLKTGSWDSLVSEASAAQMLYDIGNTSTNMLPSILVSIAVEAALPTVGEGGVVFAGLTGAQIAAGAGALTMGASAMGNAKQEMLGMGYSVEQATAYGLMVGASEAGLSYLLSGIPGLRGGDGVFSALGQKAITKVDNALAKAAIALGGDMLDEGLEEGLQTVLEGWFKEIATGVDFEDPSAEEILYSSLLGALTAAGFGGGKLAISGTVGGVKNAIKYNNLGKSYANMGGQSGVGALAAQGLSLNQDTAAYKQAGKIQTRLDKGKSASNYSVGKLLSSMSESQTSTAVQTRLSAHIENKNDVRKLSNTITDILYGREVSDKALSAVADNKYALNTLNDVLGAKLKKGATVSDVKAAVKSYRAATTSKSGANASTNAKQGSEVKISGGSDATFSVQENADGKFDVIAEVSGNSGSIASYETQKQAQAAAYGYTLGMGAEGVSGLVNLSANLPDGVDLGEAALAFNAIYSQGKSGKAFSAAKNMELLSPEQRQYAYNLGIMDKALDGARAKNVAAEISKENDGKVLQKDGESGKIIEETQEDIENEREDSIRLREGSERNDGKNTGGQVSTVESGTGEAEEQGSGSSQEKRSASIKAFVESEGLRKVCSKIIGIITGTDTENIFVIPESVYDEGMRQIVEEQAAQGRKVIFVSGAMEIVENGEIIEARGVISADGKTMWIQADDATVAPEQISLHEEFHAKVKADPSLIGRMKAKVKEKYKGKLELLTEVYANLYFTDDNGKRTVSDDYIIEEILADAYAGIDVLETVSEAEVRATEFSEDIREGAKSIESARAPPANGEVRASRSSGDLYTATADFMRDVAKDDRHAFARSLANKTSNIKSGEIRHFEIYCANRIYFFQADGYMTGEVLKSVSNKRPNLYKQAREDFYNGIKQSGEGADIWAKFDSFEKEGSFDYSGFSRYRGTASRNDSIFEESSGSDGTRSVSSSSGYNYSAQEVDSILEALKKKYGVDDAGIKASRSLKSPQDVAKAYIDAVPNRLILANALESQADNAKAKELLAKYKSKISDIEADQTDLDKTKSELHDLYFAEGRRRVERIKTLEEHKNKLEARIDNADRWLLKYEEMKPIKDIIERARKDAYQKALNESNAKMAKLRERMEVREERARQERREMRERASDRRHSSEIKGKIKAFKEKLQRTLRHPTDRKYIPGALAQAMIDVCELIDTDTELYKADGSINKAQERRERTRESLRLLRAEYNNIKKDADPLYSGEYDGYIAAYLDTLEGVVGGKSLDEMSRSELEDMYKILQSIDDTLREARKLIGWKEAADVYESGDVIISEQQKISEERRKGKRSIFKKAYDGVGNASLSPVRRVLEICGYDRNSPLYKLFKEFEKGVRKVRFFEMGAKKSFEALTTGKNAKIYEKAIYKADGGNRYTDSKGRKFGISKMQKMQAILSFEREVANKKTHHIEKGGLMFADLDALGKGNLKAAVNAEISHKVRGSEAVKLVEQFKKELEGDRWAQDYMAAARFFFDETAKSAINDAYMKLKHRILATDLAYIPFETDPNSITREISAEYDAQPTISAFGMLQETQNGASNALVMTGLNNILERHIQQVSIIHGLAVPIRNFNKVWNVKSADSDVTVKEQVESTAGAGARKLIEQTVMDLQGERHQKLPRWYKKAKSNYIGAQFWWNFSVIGKQISSLFSATTMLRWRDPMRMLANLVVTATRRKKIAAEVDKYTATAWMRRQGLSDAELESLSTQKRRTWFGKVIKSGSKGMIWMDHMVALSLWKYAKQDVAKKTGLRGEELMKATAEFYDELIENTQSMTDVLHRPEVQRSGGVGTELFGTFKTDLYQNAGNLRMAVGEFTHNRTKENAAKVAKTVGSIMTSALWASMVTSIIAALRYKVDRYRDEEDELTAESWLKVQGEDLIIDLAGYVLPAFGSEIAEVGFNLGNGYQFVDAIFSAIPYDAFNDLYAEISKTISKEDPSIDDYLNIIVACGNVLGLPTNNIYRSVKAAENHIKDWINGELFSFNEGYYSSKKISKTDKLYRAMMNDDEDRIEQMKAKFDDESEVKSAIKKAIREKDPRVQVAVEAVMNYDYKTFSNLRDEIIDEGHFDYKTVKTAFEDEREYILRKLKEAREEKKKGDLEDYEDIIDALIERGYSEELIEKKLNIH